MIEAKVFPAQSVNETRNVVEMRRMAVLVNCAAVKPRWWPASQRPIAGGGGADGGSISIGRAPQPRPGNPWPRLQRLRLLPDSRATYRRDPEASDAVVGPVSRTPETVLG